MLFEQMEFDFMLVQSPKDAIPSRFEQMEFDFEAPALESVG